MFVFLLLLGCLAQNLTRDAIVFGWPHVWMLRQMNELTFRAGGFDKIINIRTLAKPDTTTVPSPNQDTIYSSVWFDIRSEPKVFQFPAITDRHYVFQFLDFETNVIGSLSPRNNPTNQAMNVILSTKPIENLPANTVNFVSFSSVVWGVVRLLVTNDTDLPKALEIQDQLRVVPYHEFTKGPKPAPMPPLIRPLAPVTPSQYLPRIGWAIQTFGVSEPTLQDFMKFKEIGLDLNGYNGTVDTTEDYEKAKELIRENDLEKEVNGWKVTFDAGKFGTNYLLRATIAEFFLAINIAEDALYYSRFVDDQQRTLQGQFKYEIVINKPIPAKGFWSITAYNEQQQFEKNDYDKYRVGTGSNFTYESDGSLKLILSAEPPLNMNNWLPVPKGNFNLILRAYEPEASLFDFTYALPQIVRQ